MGEPYPDFSPQPWPPSGEPIPIVLDRRLVRESSPNWRGEGTRLACVLLMICLIWTACAAAQTCPAPWNNASNVYGIVFMEGSGNGSADGYTQSVNQQAVVQGKLAGLGACVWEALPQFNLGQMKSFGYENDTVVYTPNGT